MGALQLDPSSGQHVDVADYLAHLHICATTLALEQGDATVARAHTLKSLVVSPENVQPRLSLIELYARTECRREARGSVPIIVET